jgi:hypothetical protein
MRKRAGASGFPKRFSALKANKNFGLVKQVFRKGRYGLRFDGAKSTD